MADKILIVEDDRDICEILEFNLQNEGFQVQCAHSAEEGLKDFTTDFSLILLDVMMSGMSGYKMAEKLRSDGIAVPIIFLTAKDTENDMLTGFSLGADDYIPKPFSVKEVIARVRAVIRRSKANTTELPSNPDMLQLDDIKINLKSKDVEIGGRKVELTKTEYEIFILLAKNPEKVFSREEIIDTVWSETPYITERTVDVHITRLRKKLGENGSLITNRSGYGYRLNLLKD